MAPYKTPGVYIETISPSLAVALRTGVPAFLGYAGEKQTDTAPVNTAIARTLWSQFQDKFVSAPNSYLADAVRGFFDNGGRLCYVVRLTDTTDAITALNQALKVLASEDAIDLICAPDIMRPLQPASGPLQPPDPHQVQVMQTAVLNHCDSVGDRFALLDSLPRAPVDQVLQQRSSLSGTNGALYYPWIRIADGPSWSGGFLPPCGHVAGVYSSTDERVGVFKAPANEALDGVLDLEVNLTNAQQEGLNPEGINCLRAFPGRGIRVWGARTLSRDAAWIYISVRRLFLTVARWIDRNMADAVFEPNDVRLWARIERDLTSYFADLFRRGALKGNTAQEAFYVKCAAETNPPEVRDTGAVITEIGLAPALPNEFVVVRIIQTASGTTIVGPTRPG